MSPDLTREDPGVPPNIGNMVADDPAKGKHRGVIYSLAPSPLDANLIWAGTDDGLIWVTRDGGKNWQNVTPPGLTAWSKIAQLDASHFDAGTAYAAVNRFRLDDLHAYAYRTHDGGKTWQKITNGLPDDASVNVVREDPVRRGLLFAGTERAIHVSFNDGDSWQSLQLNLPATSMRDLVIHGDDIVVGTHGRSFWILDDITPLRQIDDRVAGSAAFLFKPGIAYRIWRNANTDTPLPPEIPAGKNPPDGAIIDYDLKSAATGPLKLEILDSNGKIVRSFSSADKPEVTTEQLQKELNVPLYWVRPPQILSAEAGMHRFVWDLRLSPPRSLFHEYPISAIPHDTPRYPLGPAVLPGKYTVRLSSGGQDLTQELEIKMDPRVPVTPGALAEQFQLASKIHDAMNASYDGLAQAHSVRIQVKSLAGKVPNGTLSGSILALDQKAASFEGSARRFGLPVRQDSFSKLNAQLGQLLAVVDGADAAPTKAAEETFATVQSSLADLSNSWAAVKEGELAALNDQLRKANLPEINPAVVAELEEDSGGDDEP